MKTPNKILALVVAMIFSFATTYAFADDSIPRPVTSVYALEMGSGSALSTYLSPLKYTGSYFAISGEWSKAFSANPEHCVMAFEAGGNYQYMKNPAKTALMVGLQAYFNWGMAYRHRLPYNLQVSGGANIDINCGALYLLRNSNNPIAANIFTGIDLNASLSWHSKIGKIPFIISDQIKLPSLGIFFSPEYGESYYEIYLGNSENLMHAGWWGNHFGINNLISVKFDFGRTALELGYRYSIQTSWANDINTHIISNALVIGVIPQGLGLKKKRNANYSLY